MMSRSTRLSLVNIVAVFTLLASITAGESADLFQFWETPQYGANSFNRAPPDQDYFNALAKTGATWTRLTFSKWDGEGKDFLIGDADNYTGIPQEDLATLRSVLNRAHKAGIKVVIVPLSLPGARWTQQNGGTFDDRLWSSRVYWEQTARFWTDLADALRDHSAVVAYNIINEPAPEKTRNLRENDSLEKNRDFISRHATTTRDLPGFYNYVIAAIRAVDTKTPIMVDGGYYANPRNLAAWPEKLRDDHVLYAFHMYEPYAATSMPNMRRSVPLRYPGVKTDYSGESSVEWDKILVKAHIKEAFKWAKAQGLPPTRIVAAEFGCMRLWKDCGSYLTDVIDAIDVNGGHWAFYAFREDEWEGMDYELPKSLGPGRFYQLIEEGRKDKIPRNGALIDLLKVRMDK